MTALVGGSRLLVAALRRDRILLLAWLLAIGGLSWALVASVVGLYGSAAERAEAARFNAANVVSRVFDGPASGAELGAIAMVQAFGVLAVLVALMCAQAVVRHTRLEEETGRAELVGSAVVGRHAQLAAGLGVAIIAATAAGGVGAAVLGANGLPWAGSALSGALVTGVGVVFAGVAAVAAQVSSTSRAANASAGAVLGLAYLLRGVGDALGTVRADGVLLVSAWPSWLSPIGWGQQARPFHQDNAEVLVLFALLAVVLIATAVLLQRRRDVGAGMIPVPPGPARADRRLATTLGLAWRLQRGTLLGWSVGVAVLGVAFGAVGQSAEEVVGLSQELEAALQALAPDGGLVELYFAFAVGFLGPVVAGYTVQALLRMRAEEVGGRLEPLLATAVARRTWLASHLTIAAIGTVVLLALLGATATAAHGLLTGGWSQALVGLLGGALLQAPAALLVGAVVASGFAVWPKVAAVLGWGVLAASFVMGQFGSLLSLPQWALNLSPFTHVAGLPRDAQVAALLSLGATAIALLLLAVAAFRRRDIVTGT